MTNRIRHIINYLLCAFVILQVLLVFFSWIITAVFPDIHMRSLLSAEGIRWMLGEFTSNMNASYLGLFLILCITVGSIYHSHFINIFSKKNKGAYRRRLAIRIVCTEFVVCLAVMLLLTIVPHAILLSISGELYDSSFSRSIIPYCCMTICLMSISYGFATGAVRNLAELTDNLTYGISRRASLILLYIVATQFLFSMMYVLA